MLKFTFDVAIVSNSKPHSSQISRRLPQCPTYQYCFNMERWFQRVDLTLQANLLERNVKTCRSFASFKPGFVI